MSQITGGAFWLLVVAATAPALAQSPDAVRAEEIAVQAWGETHRDCIEWGDGCVVCRRAPEAPACSTPGIACTAQPTTCRAVPKP